MRTIHPKLAKLQFGDNTLCGASKMVFCEHDKKTLFGGVAVPNISKETDEEWHMAIGSLIFVPLKTYNWKEDMYCGWTIEDIIHSGLDSEYWEEKI